MLRASFVKGPDGKILKVKAVEGYLQWCEKVLRTKRFVHSSYTDLYGEEYYTLIGSDMTKSALELEVKRMTIEALMVHPFTEKVNRFDFKWDEHKSELYFSFHAYTVFGEEYTTPKSFICYLDSIYSITSLTVLIFCASSSGISMSNSSSKAGSKRPPCFWQL